MAPSASHWPGAPVREKEPRQTSDPDAAQGAGHPPGKREPALGYLPIKGELKRLGHGLPATTIRDILRRAAIDPSPRRGGPSWSEFLHQQAASIVAADFFTVYTLWGRVLYVLFFIELSTRKVHVVGCTANPDGDWAAQQARNFTFISTDGVSRPGS
jgi:hypothetical protein